MNEDTLLSLLATAENGWRPYLATILPGTPENPYLIRYVNAEELYDFVMAYGTFQQAGQQGSVGQGVMAMPTGALRAWDEPVSGPPEVVR